MASVNSSSLLAISICNTDKQQCFTIRTYLAHHQAEYNATHEWYIQHCHTKLTLGTVILHIKRYIF